MVVGPDELDRYRRRSGEVESRGYATVGVIRRVYVELAKNESSFGQPGRELAHRLTELVPSELRSSNPKADEVVVMLFLTANQREVLISALRYMESRGVI